MNRPPGAVTDLAAPDHDDTALLLTWTAPGADAFEGTASRYDLRFATNDSVPWNAMTRVAAVPAPCNAGSPESLWVRGLATDTRFSFLLATADSDSSWSALSNRASGTTGDRDRTPPGIIVLRFEGATPTSITVAWRAPGDDDTEGIASRYDARVRDSGGQEWRMIDGLPPPRPAGDPERATIDGLSPERRYLFTARAVDDAGNAAPWAHELVASTTSEADAHWWEGFAPAPTGQGVDGPVIALAAFQGMLVAGGRFTRAGMVPASGFAAWDGSAWSPLGTGVSGNESSEVRRLITDGTLLYVGGHFATMDGIATGAVAVWDGSGWSAPGEGVHGSIKDLAFHEGALIAAGGFRIGASGPSIRFARWNGTSWTALPMREGLYNVSLASHLGVLYAGTHQNIIDGDSTVELFRLAGDRWLPVMYKPLQWTIPMYCCDGIHGLRVLGGTLYAVGRGINYFGDVAIFDGTRWSGQDLQAASTWESVPYVACVAETWGRSVIGGWFALQQFPGSCDIAIRESGSWRPLGSGIGYRDAWPGIVNGTVLALAEFQGALYAGGSFDQAGRKPSANIARWTP